MYNTLDGNKYKFISKTWYLDGTFHLQLKIILVIFVYIKNIYKYIGWFFNHAHHHFFFNNICSKSDFKNF